MSYSRDLQILGAAVAALREAWIVEHRVFEMRGHSLNADQLPAIDVALVSAESQALTIHASGIEHRLSLQVDVCAQETAADVSVARTVDPIMVRAHQVLMTDATIAGLCADIRLTEREWIDDRAAGGFMRLRMTYEVEHYSSGTDLSSEP